MPKQFERKTEKGKEYIYIGNQWNEIKSTEKTQNKNRDTSQDVEVEIKIGDVVLKAIGIPKMFGDKSNRAGYRLQLKSGQTFWGAGNIFLR